MSDVNDNAAIEAILERRRAFVREALARGGGAGFPLTYREAGGEPDLLTTALVLPDAARSLTPTELARVVGWVLTHQGPGGGFVPRTERTASAAAVTAHVHAALLALQLRGLANARWVEARRRAAGWIAGRAEAATRDLPAHEMGGLASALAVSVGVQHAPLLYRTLSALTAELSHRLEAEPTAASRLWLARGLMGVFHELGSRGHLEQVVAVLHVLTGGMRAAEAEPLDTGHEALLVSLACEAGVAARVAEPVARVAEALENDTIGDEVGADPLSGGCVARAFAHEALVRYAREAEGHTQVPIWIRTGEGEIETSPVVKRRSGHDDDGAPAGRHGRVHAVFLPHEPLHQACPYLRVHAPLSRLEPASAVSYEPGADVTRRYVLLSTAAFERADVIIMQRLFPTWLLGAATLPRIERSGTAIVYDLDDLLLEMPPEHPLGDALAPTLPELRRALATADVVTTSTDVLAANLTRLGASHVMTIPNAVDSADWTPPAEPSRPDDPDRPLHLACVGTSTHRRDYARIADALLALFERHPGRLRLSIWGDAPRALAEHPAVSVDPTYVSSYREYAAKLCAAEIDVGLAPLAPCAFNASKSAVKWLELSAAGVAGVYPRMGQYAEWIRDGEDGCLAGDDPGDWAAAIEALLTSPERRRAIAGAARSRVLTSHTMAGATASWAEAVEEARRRRTTRRHREATAATHATSGNPIRIPLAELLSA